MAKKRKHDDDSQLLNMVMPGGQLLRNCSPAEIAVMKKWNADKATIGDLDAAGPATAAYAFMIAREIIFEQSKHGS